LFVKIANSQVNKDEKYQVRTVMLGSISLRENPQRRCNLSALSFERCSVFFNLSATLRPLRAIFERPTESVFIADEG